jgi:KDO2-lipid IV(A) lauroyltransferase
MGLLLRLLAKIPTPALYPLGWLFYQLVYRVARYRRRTVRENLRHAFPDRSTAERARIERDSYRHLANLFLEIIRGTAMAQSEFSRRVSFRNLELLYEVTDGLKRQAIVLLIHQGNWEWMLHGAMAQLPVSVDPVYKPLHSEFWNDYMLAARSRFGAQPMALADVGRSVIRRRREQRVIVMLADQAGPAHEGYWTDFLGRPASFYRGAEKLAQSLKLPLLFAQCRRKRPGYYEIELHALSLPPHEVSGDGLLEAYVRRAETVIAEQPATYLWTNRRWKKQPPGELESI